MSVSPALVESDSMNMVLSEDEKAITIPRCANASAFGLRGYVDTLSPLVAMHHHDPECA